MPPTSLAHIALHSRSDDVLADAVSSARRVIGAKTAFAAECNASGVCRITVRDGLRQSIWGQLHIRKGRGLGGRVLAEKRPLVSADYVRDPTIADSWRDAVRAEGLRAFVCLPINVTTETTALLYLGDRAAGGPGSRAFDELLRIAEMASVGLTILARESGPQSAPTQTEAALTNREQEVLDELSTGASNRQIAERLGLVESTVKGYVQVLMQKLHARSRLQIVIVAQEMGLLIPTKHNDEETRDLADSPAALAT